MYKFQGDIQYPDINTPLPQPRSQLNPVYRLVVEGSFLQEQVAIMRVATRTSELAKTTILKDGIPVTGTDTSTRNCYIVSETNITEPIKSVFDSFVDAAWGNFTFSHPTPTSNNWQCLAYKSGGFFVAHYDDSRGHVIEGKNYLFRNTPERSMTVLLYLNDDYEGGEISFPNIVDVNGVVVCIKPRAGEFIAFPSHELYKHKVEPVTSGERYVVSRWYDDAAWFRDAGQLNITMRGELLGLNVNSKQQRFVNPSLAYTDATEELTQPNVKAVWQSLQGSDVCHRHALVDCYMEVNTGETKNLKPIRSRNYFETRINCVPRWSESWGGNMIWFAKNTGKAIHVNSVDPWAIKQYRADTPNIIQAVHADANYILRSLVFVSYRTYEISPELRPKQWLL